MKTCSSSITGRVLTDADFDAAIKANGSPVVLAGTLKMTHRNYISSVNVKLYVVVVDQMVPAIPPIYNLHF